MIAVYHNSMPTGEQFGSWNEVFEYFAEMNGGKLESKTRFQIRRGQSFRIGGLWFQCQAVVASAVAA